MSLRIKQQRGSIYLYEKTEYVGSISLKKLYQTITGLKYSGRKPKKVEIPEVTDADLEAFTKDMLEDGRNKEFE